MNRQAFRLPAGCEANLSGQYVHDSDPSYRYMGSDDGGTLILHLFRTFDDAGSAMLIGDAGTAVVLRREPTGFWGAVYAQGFLPSGSCEVQFPTQVVACDDAGLVLNSVSKALIDERCQTAAVPQAERSEGRNTLKHRLVRFSPAGEGS